MSLFKPSQSRVQADAVKAFLSVKDFENVYALGKYTEPVPTIHEWYNGREEGYVVCFQPGILGRPKTLNIVFYEHRNNDKICSIVWKSDFNVNPPTIEDILEDVYRDKWDFTHQEDFGNVAKMADWIMNRLQNYWDEYVESIKKKIDENDLVPS